MRVPVLVLALLALGATASQAQTRWQMKPEIRPFAGAYVPTGAQRDVLKDALVVGSQVALEVNETAHLVGTFAWSQSKDRLLTRKNSVNLYQGDVGGEYFRSYDVGSNWMLRPFGGLGVGVRAFDYKDIKAHAKGYLSGYGSAGTELQSGAIAIRLEARDYVYRMRGLSGNEAWKNRNDLAFLGGIAWHLR
jgi:hypothetical protein